MSLRHISKSLLPSEKQVRYLDYLARQLGHENGRTFIIAAMPQLKDQGPLTFNRTLVHNAIDWAKNRLRSNWAHIERPRQYSRDTDDGQPVRKRDQAPQA